jgi:general stress protein 26
MSELDNPQFPLDPADQEMLLSGQHECALIWSTRDGWPVGTMMTYLWRDGKIWMTSGGRRPRVAAVRRDGRVCVIVSGQAPGNASLAVTLKGRCRLHQDAATKQWFFDQLAQMAFPDNEGARQGMLKLLSSPDRVVLSVTVEKRLSYDGTKMAQALMNAMQSAP